MTEDQAKLFFTPCLDWIRAAWQQGWNDYHQRMSHPDDDSRFRATTIQNRAIIHAKLTCGAFGISYFTYNSRRLFRFGTEAIMQFKKFSEDMLPMNNVNDAVKAFDSQEPILGLGDMPRLIAGYRPNELHTDYSLYIALPKSHYANNWLLNISADEQLLQLNLPSDQPVAPTGNPARVRAKGIAPAASADKPSASA